MPGPARLRRFLGLPASDRGLLLRALVTMTGVRIVLRACPWPAASRWFARRGRVRVPGARDGRVPVERLRWAVLAVAHERPGASCLAQALTLQVLLARSGRPSVLRLGVAGGPATAFAAHAWLEHDGRILVGERRSTYASLPVPDGRSLFGG